MQRSGTPTQFRWFLPDEQVDPQALRLAQALGCPPSFASLLIARGHPDAEAANRFLRPRLRTLGDPRRLPDLDKAVERLLAAIDEGRRIVLYGDYDVDGVTSIALLTRLLAAYGVQAPAFIPRRVEEGYGLSVDGVRRCLSTLKPELLVALDCGTSSPAEIAALHRCGVEVIVIDHHECKEELPECAALVNPKRPQPDLPCPENGDDYRYLCTVGLVFKVCHALLRARPTDFDLRDGLDLVALGSVADIVPLVHENRILVHHGLLRLAETRWVGLEALMEVAGVRRDTLSPSEVSFQLAPRLNAAGRVGTAQDALELLLTDDPARAAVLARSLDLQNRDRQQVEKTTFEEAEAQVTDPEASAIVLGARGWHPGVLGIVASRICRKYHRPTWVIGFDERGHGKGSGRSIDGLSLITALEGCSHLLEKHGGHEMAAGLTLREEAFEAFADCFREKARSLLSDDDLLPKVRPDSEVAFSSLDEAFLSFHEALQPFGMGNAQPLFVARGVTPAGELRVLKERHLRMQLGQNGACREALCFNTLPDDLPRPPWDIAFKVEANTWRGRTQLQIQVQRIRSST